MKEQLTKARALRALPLPMRLTLPYSAGQIVDGAVSTALSTFLFFYVTAVCGLSAGLAGLALAVGLIVDAVLDPFIGSSSDAWRSRLGRRLPFMLLGLPLTAAAFILIFSLPTGMDQWLLFSWVSVLSIVLRVSQSLFHLPYQAVGAELTDDYAGRSSLMAWKLGIGTIGGIAAIPLGFGIFFAGKDGLSQHENYLPYAVTVSLVFVAAGLLACWSIFVTRDRQHAPAISTEPFYRRFRLEILEVFRNRSFLALFASSMLFFSGLGVHGALGVHMGTFFWKLTPAQMQAMAVAVPIGLLIGAPLAALILKSMEKRLALSIGFGFIAIAMSISPILRVLGLLPLEGEALALLLTAIAFVTGMVAALGAIAIASMLADAVDEHEHLFGARREGLYFAAWVFAGKAAAGVGSLTAGLVLEGIGFPSGVTKLEQAADLSQRTIDLLGLFGGPAAGFMLLASAIACTLYRLDSRKHAAIMDDLRARARARDELQAEPS